MDAIFVMTSNLAQREIADEAIRARSKMPDPDDPEAAEPISDDFKDKVGDISLFSMSISFVCVGHTI